MSEKSSTGTEKPAATDGATAVAPAKPATTPHKRPPKRLPPFHVVLLNDDDHTHEYVIKMLKNLFGHNEQQGFKLAEEVDKQGRAIVFTTHKELAELKRDQIHAFGRDERVATCQGAMSAVVEPAEDS
jgi:ATP-dependent Clp protease adaptor protein ClpS